MDYSVLKPILLRGTSDNTILTKNDTFCLSGVLKTGIGKEFCKVQKV